MEDWTICRLCLQSNEDLKSIPDVTYNMIPFCNLYFEIVGITFTEYRTFPKKICISCEEEMIRAYKFREKILEAEDKLKELLSDESGISNIEFIPTAKIPDVVPDVTEEDKEERTTEENSNNPRKLTKSEKMLQWKTKSIQCKKCSKIFKGIEKFKSHNCCKPPKPPQENDFDTTKYKRKTVRSATTKKIHECKECKKTFSTHNGFMLHMDKHNNFVRYECNECGKKFSHWVQRRNHIYRVHLKQKYCVCSHCGQGFDRKYDLTTHINAVHLKTLTYQCEHCGRTFKHLYNLRPHMNTHISERIKCTVCEKELKTRKTLQQHMRTHSNEKNYICPVCSKGFTCNFSMKTHVRKLHPDDTQLLPPEGTIVNKKYLAKLEDKYK